MSRGVRVARWLAAVVMIAYGFAKLTGSQFTVLDSELTRPMGEVSGFWLTWYYFGFSSIYGTIIALVEIGGGLLLIWPRTSLLGALVLLPVVGKHHPDRHLLPCRRSAGLDNGPDLSIDDPAARVVPRG